VAFPLTNCNQFPTSSTRKYGSHPFNELLSKKGLPMITDEEINDLLDADGVRPEQRPARAITLLTEAATRGVAIIGVRRNSVETKPSIC
jgi:hypothetical protein